MTEKPTPAPADKPPPNEGECHVYGETERPRIACKVTWVDNGENAGIHIQVGPTGARLDSAAALALAAALTTAAAAMDRPTCVSGC